MTLVLVFAGAVFRKVTKLLLWRGCAVCFVLGVTMAGIVVYPQVEAYRSATDPVVTKLAQPPGVGPVYRVPNTTAVAALQSLDIRKTASKAGYSREKFGAAWSDVDANGCDTRNDILQRDLEQVELQTGSLCVVASGQLSDPYTGEIISFRRGPRSAAVQIDHAVALSDAWKKGAQDLSGQQRLAFANDPLNLIAVDGAANQEKSDSDAADWLPPNDGYRCAYVARQISVKIAYSLWVSQEESEAMRSVLTACPQIRTQGSGLRGI